MYEIIDGVLLFDCPKVELSLYRQFGGHAPTVQYIREGRVPKTFTSKLIHITSSFLIRETWTWRIQKNQHLFVKHGYRGDILQWIAKKIFKEGVLLFHFPFPTLCNS